MPKFKQVRRLMRDHLKINDETNVTIADARASDTGALITVSVGDFYGNAVAVAQPVSIDEEG